MTRDIKNSEKKWSNTESCSAQQSCDNLLWKIRWYGEEIMLLITYTHEYSDIFVRRYYL